jgi:hypothetical protein
MSVCFYCLVSNFALSVTQAEECNISNCAQASYIVLSLRISHAYLSCYVSSSCHQGLDPLTPNDL